MVAKMFLVRLFCTPRLLRPGQLPPSPSYATDMVLQVPEQSIDIPNLTQVAQLCMVVTVVEKQIVKWDCCRCQQQPWQRSWRETSDPLTLGFKGEPVLPSLLSLLPEEKSHQ